MGDDDDEKREPVGVDVSASATSDNEAPSGGEASDGDGDNNAEPTVNVYYEKCVVCNKPPGKLNGRKPLLNSWCSLACAEHWLAKGGDDGVKLLEKYSAEKRTKWTDKTFSKRETKLMERLVLFKALLKRQSQWNQKVFLAAAVVTLLMALIEFTFIFPPIDFVIWWAGTALVAAIAFPQPEEVVPGEGPFGKLGKKIEDDEDDFDSELIAGQWVKKNKKSKKGISGSTGKGKATPQSKGKQAKKKD